MAGGPAHCEEGQPQAGAPGQRHFLTCWVLKTKVTSVSSGRHVALPSSEPLCDLGPCPAVPHQNRHSSLARLSPSGSPTPVRAWMEWPPWPALCWTMPGQRRPRPKPVLEWSVVMSPSWEACALPGWCLDALGLRGGREDAQGGQPGAAFPGAWPVSRWLDYGGRG